MKLCVWTFLQHKSEINTLERYKKVASAQIVIFQSDFFGGFILEVLTTSIITFDMCLAKFIIETGVWSLYEGDRGNCMQFMVNDDNELNEAEFLRICS